MIRLKRRFTLATGSRTETAAVLVRINDGSVSGFGEASLSPYRKESVDSVVSFLERVVLPPRLNAAELPGFLKSLEHASGGNEAALAAVDSALHDLIGKQGSFRWHEVWGLDPRDVPPTSFTISMGTREEIQEQVKESSAFSVLKIKLGGSDDRSIIGSIRQITDIPIRVDVNQGWKDREEAAAMIDWLAGQNVELVEQPLPADRQDDQIWLKQRSQLPLIADEAAERSRDLGSIAGLYDGVNVKLMKCGGMAEGKKMIEHAKGLGLRVMLGCMTETSCAISAASQLAALADWIDLDGALLVSNDPFTGVGFKDGRARYPATFGNGVSAHHGDWPWIFPGEKSREN